MEYERYLECLAADAARLREVAGRDLSAPVPSCPEWTAAGTEDFGDSLADCDGRSVLVRSAQRSWRVRPSTAGVQVTPGRSVGTAEATVSGSPVDVLLWRRVGDEAVEIGGDVGLLAKVRQLLGCATV